MAINHFSITHKVATLVGRISSIHRRYDKETYVELKSRTFAFSGLIPIGRMMGGGFCFSLLDIFSARNFPDNKRPINDEKNSFVFTFYYRQLFTQLSQSLNTWNFSEEEFFVLENFQFAIKNCMECPLTNHEWMVDSRSYWVRKI